MGDMNTEKTRIAYLIHTFPLYSTTFITNEIDEMRRQGAVLNLFAVQCPGPSEYPDNFRRFYDETTYLFPIKLFKFVTRIIEAIIKRPILFIRTFYEAITWGTLSFKDRTRTIMHFIEALYFYPDLARAGYHHLHVHFLSGGASIALFLNRLYGINYSLTAHGTDIFVEKVLLREKISHSKFTRVGTEYNRKYLYALFPEGCKTSIEVIPFGIDINAIPKPAGRSVQNSGIRLLNVGRLTWQKAQDLLLEACAVLKNEKIEFSLVIVGEGELRPLLEKKIDKLGLSGNVSMPGKMSESHVLKEYHSADIFILSSVSEGFGVVLLEAMASGLAVIAPSLNGIPEIIEDGVNGRLFTPGSVNELALIIKELAEDSEKRMRFAEAGFRKVKESFQLSDSVSRFYQTLTDKIGMAC